MAAMGFAELSGDGGGGVVNGFEGLTGRVADGRDSGLAPDLTRAHPVGYGS
jgi:hypothetical protein